MIFNSDQLLSWSVQDKTIKQLQLGQKYTGVIVQKLTNIFVFFSCLQSSQFQCRDWTHFLLKKSPLETCPAPQGVSHQKLWSTYSSSYPARTWLPAPRLVSVGLPLSTILAVSGGICVPLSPTAGYLWRKTGPQDTLGRYSIF